VSTAFETHRPALHAVASVRHRTLVRTLGDAYPFHADREPREVHHDEHVLEAAVLLAHDVTRRATVIAVRHHRSRTRVDAELVLERNAMHVVACPERSIVVDQKLAHDEER